MTEFPKSMTQLLHGYQIELEEWVTNATLREIKEYLLLVHGFVYPDDWSDFLQHLSHSKNYISGCFHCQEILFAINTISETARPELKCLFKE